MGWLAGLLALALAALILLWILWFPRRPLGTSSSQTVSNAGCSVWSFQGGRWVLSEDRSAPGFVPGAPPTRPGEFDGDSVRVPSVPGQRG
jgi:hypothetical protein